MSQRDRLTTLEGKAPAPAESPEQQRDRLTALARSVPHWNMALQCELLHCLGPDDLARLTVELTGCTLDDALAFVQVVSKCDRGI